MTDKIMQLASVIQREMDALQTVAQNTANLNTIGYKAVREFNVLQSAPEGTQDIQATIQSRTNVNLGNGALQQTGKPLDLAISGDAWFVVQTPDGIRMTRDGRFHVDQDGYLVNTQGLQVLGQNGPISTTVDQLKINTDGVLQIGDQQGDQLRLVNVANPALLTSMGNGLYKPLAPVQSAKDYLVHQGMLERSNVNMGQDMVKIMELSRHVESVQRALVSYNGMLESGINQIGK